MSVSDDLLPYGRFFFRYRNVLFPLFVLLICSVFPPSGHGIAGEGLGLLGIGLLLVGLTARASVIGYAYIRRGGVDKQVYADDLVTGGFFAMSRNPLYVGNLLIYVGLFLVHGNPLTIALGTAFFLFAYCAIVAAEESYLETKFGDRYHDYQAVVPRWVPDLSKRREALAPYAFNWRRVIAKDYSTMCSTGLALLYVLGLRAWHRDGWPGSRASLLELVMAGAAVLALTLVARTAKKSGWLGK